MKKFTNPLDNIHIASPCKADWNAMFGDERRRFCAECKLNVYNLSGMTQPEAENFLINSEGRVCVRFYRRADGSVITQDCPVGWKALKRRVSKTATALASMIFGVASGLGFAALFGPPKDELKKISVIESNISTTGIDLREPVSSSDFDELEVKGEYIMARPSNLDNVRRQIKKSRNADHFTK